MPNDFENNTENIEPSIEPNSKSDTKAVLAELKIIVENLKKKNRFDKIRLLLEKSISIYPDDLWLKAQLALGYIQDYSLMSDSRLDKAVETLDGTDPDLFPVDMDDKKMFVLALAEKAFKTSSDSEGKKWLDKLNQYGLSKDEQERVNALENAWKNKTGLALSGGGFRASLYHIGVLARLAELDQLRNIEVISTVSGGSIVGVHYYLELKHLLESKPDEDISREDYIRIVKNVHEDFLKGVQENIRTHAISNFMINLEMIISEKYSRSHRLGELYETLLYEKVRDGHEKGQPRYMKDLIIQPKGEYPDFKPGKSNWRRKAKVPIILINATSLNTGHNWIFAASYMGEPPGLLQDREVDKNARYWRVRYENTPSENFKNYRLGYAVAASSCVPGAFEPLAIKGVYPGKTVRLVDGGVHDNQGLEGLLDENCKIIYCSDASGQMHDKDAPSDLFTSVLLRSSAITMDRVREELFQELSSKLDEGNFIYLHMKKDFPIVSQSWAGCESSPEKTQPQKDLPYGIAPEVQKKISEIRTDLDSFTETEAFALMASGYLTAKKYIEPGENKDVQWKFLDIAPIMETQKSSTSAYKKLNKQLEAAASPAFKLLKLNPVLNFISLAAIFVFIIFLGKFIWASLGKSFSISVNALVIIFLIGSMPYIVSWLRKKVSFVIAKMTKVVPSLDIIGRIDKKVTKILKFIFPLRSARNIARDIIIAFIGSFLAKIYLSVFNKMFVKQGRIDRL